MAVFIGGIGATNRKEDFVYDGILRRLDRDGYANYDYISSKGWSAFALPDKKIYTISYEEPKFKEDVKRYKSKYSWAKALTKELKK